jgi:alkyl hydroperoxide reductase subunit AhpF
MEKEVFSPESPLMYCPNCAEKVSRKVTACPKCQQKIFKESRWPMIGLILGCILPVIFFIGILAAVAIPAYKEYLEKSESIQQEQFESDQ